jgi:RNA polymerase sigma factor (sigma-70 family)
MLSCTGHSFAQLCVPLRAELVSFARRLCGGKSCVAEDIVQDTYIKALKAWPRWTPEDKEPLQAARSWLFRIVANMWSNARRDARQHERILRAKCMRVVTSLYSSAEVAELDGPAVNDRQNHSDALWPIRAYCMDAHSFPLAHEVTVAIHRLHPKRRAIVERFYFHGQNCDTIAAALQMPATTVRTQLKRARARLRPLLERFANSNYGLAAGVAATDETPQRKKAKANRVKAVMRYRHATPLRVVQNAPDQTAAG